MNLDWLAGLLEGEGSFMCGPPSKPNLPIVSIEMVDRDIIERAAALMGTSVLTNKARRAEWKESYVARARGERGVELMRALRPLMGERRQAQIDKALASYVPAPPREEHGTGGYRRGCRCKDCRAAVREYARVRRQAALV